MMLDVIHVRTCGEREREEKERRDLAGWTGWIIIPKSGVGGFGILALFLFFLIMIREGKGVGCMLEDDDIRPCMTRENRIISCSISSLVSQVGPRKARLASSLCARLLSSIKHQSIEVELAVMRRTLLICNCH